MERWDKIQQINTVGDKFLLRLLHKSTEYSSLETWSLFLHLFSTYCGSSAMLGNIGSY